MEGNVVAIYTGEKAEVVYVGGDVRGGGGGDGSGESNDGGFCDKCGVALVLKKVVIGH